MGRSLLDCSHEYTYCYWWGVIFERLVFGGYSVNGWFIMNGLWNDNTDT